ncbi:lipoprotein [Nitrosomonas communis]|nr:lipoprotein [Nitrosomonas communis]
MRLLYLTVLLSVGLTACGLKAPLYLPHETPPPPQPSQDDERIKQ